MNPMNVIFGPSPRGEDEDVVYSLRLVEEELDDVVSTLGVVEEHKQ